MSSATDIYQELLDILSDALLEGDFEKFLPHIMLPHVMQTLSGTLTMENEEELRRSFQGYSDSLKAHKVTNYIRLVDHAEFDGPDRISGEHTTHILHNANHLVPPYPNRFVFERQGGVWRVAASVNAIANVTWPVLMPKVPPHAELPEDTAKDPGGDDAED